MRWGDYTGLCRWDRRDHGALGRGSQKIREEIDMATEASGCSIMRKGSRLIESRQLLETRKGKEMGFH